MEIIFHGFDYDIRFCGLDRNIEIHHQDLTQEVKTLLKLHGEAWRAQLLKMYPILESNPDLVSEIEPFGIPGSPDGSGTRAPWEIAIEIAARETIPDYKERLLADPKNRVSADSFEEHSLLPESKD